ncbi:hypothetical protein [Photobacterium leiognathi]|nr:hypothetical protein [Photobacterium leiognathi]
METAKLNGDETENEIHARLMAHRDSQWDGFIRNHVSFDTNGKPEYIVSFWDITEFDTGVLPKGQRYAYIIA